MPVMEVAAADRGVQGAAKGIVERQSVVEGLAAITARSRTMRA